MTDLATLAREMREGLDRLECAAMAYERLGKLTKDDAKTRKIRFDTIFELAEARRAILDDHERLIARVAELEAELAKIDEDAEIMLLAGITQ